MYQALICSITAILMRGLSIISAPLALYFLTPQEFGIVSLMTSFMNVGAVLVGLGFKHYCMVEYFHHSSDNRPQFISQLLSSYIVFITPLFIGALYFQRSINRMLFFDRIHFVVVALMIFIIFLSFFVDIINAVFQCEQQTKRLSCIHIVSALILTSSKLFLLFWAIGPSAVVWSHAFSIIPVLIMGFPLLKNSYKKLYLNIPIACGTLSKSLPYWPSTVLPWLLSASDRWSLATWSTVHDIGIYSAADLGAQLFNFLIFYTWNATYLPYIFKLYTNNHHNLSRIEHTHMRIMAMIIFAGFLLLILSFFIGKPVLLFFLPHSYHQAIPYLFILLGGQLIALAISCLSSIIQYHRKTYFISLCNVLSLIINLVGNYALIPYYHVAGCVFSTILASLCSLGLIFWYRKKLLKNSE